MTAPAKFFYLPVLVLLFALAPRAAAVPPESYRVAGIVLDSVTGAPVSNAVLSLAPVQHLDQSLFMRSSSDGRFVFASLPAGKFRLQAFHRGYVPQSLDEHEAYSTAIAVGHGLDSEHIRFRLTPESVISGAITDESGDPVRGAHVLLIRKSYFAGSFTTSVVNRTDTDDQGNYRLPHLAPGTYIVAIDAIPWYAQHVDFGFDRFTAEDELTTIIRVETMSVEEKAQPSIPAPSLKVVYPTLYYPTSDTLAGATPIVLTPGSTISADFFLHPVPAIHLSVKLPPALGEREPSNPDVNRSAQDAPPPYSLEVTTQIAGEESSPLPASVASDDGTFEVFGVAPGQLTLKASYEESGNYRAQSQSLTVTSDGVIDLHPSSATVSVSGIVLGKRKLPEQGGEVFGIPTAAVRLSSSAGRAYMAQLSSKGTFSFVAGLVEAGTYEVGLESEENMSVTSVEAQGAIVSGLRITLSAGQPVKLKIQIQEKNCTVKGIARKNGVPFAGAMILLVPESPDAHAADFVRDQSDSDGSFTLPPVLPGRYTLLALENGWNLEWSNLSVLFPYLPQGQILDLKPAQSVSANPKVQ